MNDCSKLKEEIARIRRVSDMLCTANAALRDRFRRRAMALDISTLFLAAWLVALSFVEPSIGIRLTPFSLDAKMWMGLLALGTFALTLIQLKVDWKGRADAHKRTVEMYVEVKQEASYVLQSNRFDEMSVRQVIGRYSLANAVGESVPERNFLVEKRRHLRKIALSQYLDSHPSASLQLLKMKFWWRDNVIGDKNGRS